MCLARLTPLGFRLYLIHNSAISHVLNSKFVPQDGLDVTKLEKRIKIEKRKKKNYLANVRNTHPVVGNEK